MGRRHYFVIYLYDYLVKSSSSSKNNMRIINLNDTLPEPN